jgi:hypothetical protein
MIKYALNSKKNVCLIVFLLIAISAFAQKLTNKQEVSLHAPTNIKIDGKTNEWGDQFQAYNHATDVFYTIANDGNNLYIVIKAIKPRVVEKIIDGGITFIISDATKKGISLTYPNIDVQNGQWMINRAGKKEKSSVAIPPVVAALMPVDTNKNNTTHNDSLIAVANKLLIANAKTIFIKDADGQNDTLSVYNEQKIRIASKFDKEGNYACELAIPLTYINLSPDNQKINYSIKLNGRLTSHQKDTHINYVYIGGHLTDVDQDIDSATDFWADYTLAK